MSPTSRLTLHGTPTFWTSDGGRCFEIREDPELIIDDWIDADNASFSGLDLKGATLAMHHFRGNNRSSWFGEGDYAPIAEKIFNAIDVDGFLLEFDGDRSGGFEPLRFMPRDKTVVLGLVATKTGPGRRSTTCCSV